MKVRAATISHGLHFPGGHISSVGISGFTLGGGNGWGVRHCGAAADNVAEMEVVLPIPTDAGGGVTATRVTAESDPDLFWGLRGAGEGLLSSDDRVQIGAWAHTSHTSNFPVNPAIAPPIPHC